MHPHTRIRPAMHLPPQGLGWLHAVVLLLGLWWTGLGTAFALPLPSAGDEPVHAAMISPQDDESEPAQMMPRSEFVCRVARPDLRADAAQLIFETGDSAALLRVSTSFVQSLLRPQPMLRAGLAQTVAEPLLRPPTALG